MEFSAVNQITEVTAQAKAERGIMYCQNDIRRKNAAWDAEWSLPLIAQPRVTLNYPTPRQRANKARRVRSLTTITPSGTCS